MSWQLTHSLSFIAGAGGHRDPPAHTTARRSFAIAHSAAVDSRNGWPKLLLSGGDTGAPASMECLRHRAHLDSSLVFSTVSTCGRSWHQPLYAAPASSAPAHRSIASASEMK